MLHSLRYRIAIPYTVLTLLIMLALTVFVTGRARSAHLADLEMQSLAEARLIADSALPLFSNGNAQTRQRSTKPHAAGPTPSTQESRSSTHRAWSSANLRATAAGWTTT